MGGEIGCDSAVNKGSVFWFTVRLGRATEAAEELPTNGPLGAGDLTNVHVLIVDDNAMNRTILHHQVTSMGMRDRLAADGREALDILQTEYRSDPFAVVILDLHMPGMDGFAVVETIRSNPRFENLKLIVLTSVDAAENRDHGSLRIDACLQKPVKQSQLFECLRAVVGVPSDASRPAEPVQPFPAPERPLRLLLAEDNKVNQQVAFHQLTTMGHQVDIVGSGLEALELIERNTYDAVLMDVHMPGLDGYATTAKMRERELDAKHTWIIAMTANALPADREICLEAGMDDYVAKPVSSAALAEVLARCPLRTERVVRSIDLSSLLESGMQDILPEIIETFLETSSQTAANAKTALAAEDALELYQCAHSLKGSAANLGANRLVELCGQLEDRCRSGSLTSAPAVLHSIEEQLAQVREDLSEYSLKDGQSTA